MVILGGLVSKVIGRGKRMYRWTRDIQIMLLGAVYAFFFRYCYLISKRVIP